MADLFAIPDFWKEPRKRAAESEGAVVPGLFDLKISASEISSVGLEPVRDVSSTGFFRLPLAVDIGPVDGKAPPKEQEEPSSNPGVLFDDEWDDGLAPDPWLASQDPPQLAQTFRTWARYKRPDFDDPAPLFLTEAGPAAFDNYLSSCLIDAEGRADEAVLEPRAYLACLLALALGRVSVLFSRDAAAQSFYQTTPRVRISGYSCEALDGVRDTCLECGNSVQSLRSFVRATYSKETSPYRIAMAKAVDDLLRTAQGGLGQGGRGVRSVLQLEAVVDPVQRMLAYVGSLVKRTTRARHDGDLLTALFEEAQSTEYQPDVLHEIACNFLRVVSEPWMEFIEQCIGLRPDKRGTLFEGGPGASFVTATSNISADDLGVETDEDYVLDTDKMPSFVPEDVANAMSETCRNLLFLRAFHPDHALLRADVMELCKPPNLQWQLDWDALARVEGRALSYERTVFKAIHEGRRQGRLSGSLARQGIAVSNTLEFFGKSDVQMEERLLASVEEMNRPMSDTKSADSLTTLRKDVLSRQLNGSAEGRMILTPHWSVVPMLSFAPVVNTQARVVGRECTRLLFTVHKLREHLQLQRLFQLLGNGPFCARLSDALFDPQANSAAREAGVALTGSNMGLRLGGRDTWPPASSELRLALMGILSETYRQTVYGSGSGSGLAGRATRTADSDLPGELSFAVRELSPDEMDKCMDPHGLEAMDFLRLSYKPPVQLLPVMTAPILDKYDHIFRFLLRLLWMLFATKQLFREVLLDRAALPAVAAEEACVFRFRIEAHHFVHQVAAYFFKVGVAGAWARFDAWLDVVDARLAEAEAEAPPVAQSRAAGNEYYSLDRLRQRHETTLDDMMLTLLLRRRQQPVLKLLEDIFSTILRFAKAVGEDEDEDGTGPGRRRFVASLYGSFRKKVDVFLTVCRGLGEKGNYGSKTSDLVSDSERPRLHGEENSIVQLVTMLDSSGYYGQGPAK